MRYKCGYRCEELQNTGNLPGSFVVTIAKHNLTRFTPITTISTRFNMILEGWEIWRWRTIPENETEKMGRIIYVVFAHDLHPSPFFFSSFCWLTSWFSALFIVSLIIKVKLTFNLLLFICFSFQIESVKLFYFSPFFMLTLSQYLLSVICTLLFTFVHFFIIYLVNKD